MGISGSAAAAYAALAAAAAGAATAAYGAHEQGVANANMGAYQAAVARNNETIAKGYAEAEIVKGQRLEEQKRRDTQSQISAIRAAEGASGLDVNSGSPLSLQSDTAMVGELDAQTIRNNAQRSAYGYQTEGLNYAARASMNDMESANAARAGNLGAWSSIIGGASSVSGKWSSFKTAGNFGTG